MSKQVNFAAALRTYPGPVDATYEAWALQTMRTMAKTKGDTLDESTFRLAHLDDEVAQFSCQLAEEE